MIPLCCLAKKPTVLCFCFQHLIQVIVSQQHYKIIMLPEITHFYHLLPDRQQRSSTLITAYHLQYVRVCLATRWPNSTLHLLLHVSHHYECP